MTRPEIEAKLKEIISEQLGVSEEELKNGSILTAIGADSLDLVEILMACEEEFEIELDDNMAEDQDLTFLQLGNCIEEKTKG